MDLIKNFVGPISANAIKDTAKVHRLSTLAPHVYATYSTLPNPTPLHSWLSLDRQLKVPYYFSLVSSRSKIFELNDCMQISDSARGDKWLEIIHGLYVSSDLRTLHPSPRLELCAAR
jgi:hypothetical protein